MPARSRHPKLSSTGGIADLLAARISGLLTRALFLRSPASSNLKKKTRVVRKEDCFLNPRSVLNSLCMRNRLTLDIKADLVKTAFPHPRGQPEALYNVGVTVKCPRGSEILTIFSDCAYPSKKAAQSHICSKALIALYTKYSIRPYKRVELEYVEKLILENRSSENAEKQSASGSAIIDRRDPGDLPQTIHQVKMELLEISKRIDSLINYINNIR